MREAQSNHYFGLDIGTSTVRCVVGMVSNDSPNHPTIIGHGEAKNVGIRKGTVTHVDDVAEAVVAAINDAERISGVSVERATVNVNGASVVGINSQGVIAIPAANREITAEDCMRVEEAATILQLPANREILQVFAKNYSLDGQENIKDPVGMHGIRLEVDSHIITASTPNLRNLSEVLQKSGVRVDHYTVAGLAGAEAVLTRQQKEAGTLVLDIGAGTSNLAVIEDGEIQLISVIPVGGINITNDLAIGLKTDLDIAEIVKVEHASLIDHPNRSNRVQIERKKEKIDFPMSDIHMIIEARLEELFEYVDRELAKIKRSRKLPGGVVIVGGTSKIPGIDDLAREKLQLPASLGAIHKMQGLTEGVDDPSYITAVGLMLLDMLLGDPGSYSESSKWGREKITGITKKLLRRIK